MQYLPLHLWINHILPFVYRPQCKELLRDIEDYVESLDWVRCIYEQYHGSLDREDWLMNDLFGYLNRWEPTMYGFMPCFYQFWFRCYRLQGKIGNDRDEELVEKYIRWLEMEPSDKQNQLVWGMMTVIERMRFIRHRIRVFY